jgi:hypothetical protein
MAIRSYGFAHVTQDTAVDIDPFETFVVYEMMEGVTRRT